MRPLLALAALPLLLAVPAPTQAAAGTQECQGSPATVVGQPGRFTRVYGTEGDDVIVTNGAGRAFGLGGDDKICSTADRALSIDAGAGDDVVDVRLYAVYEVYLGAGADAFQGNQEDVNKVYTDAPGESSTDTVTGGPQRDQVTTGTDGLADDDTLALGGGNDAVRVLGTSTGSIMAAGGHDYLTWESAAGSAPWLFDNRDGVVTRGADQVVARLSGIEDFDLVALGDHDLTFVGSSRSERVFTVTWFDGRRSWAGSLEARMGGGNDKLWVNGDQHPEIHGGPGVDRVRYHSPRRNTVSGVPVTMNLREGTVRSRGKVISRFYSVENAILAAPLGSTLVGSAGPNGLTLHMCGRVEGLGGDDVIKVHYGKNAACDSGRGVSLVGGPGDDLLVGGAGADSLYGGSGDDEAVGFGGSDLCRAEERRGCER